MTDQLLETIVGALTMRSEVRAIWLAGSRGRGTNDEYSDIDIWVAIDESSIAEVVADPLAYVHGITPTIMHVVAPEIAPPGGAFVGSWVPDGEGFDQVDWYITPANSARRAADTHVVLGDVPIIQQSAPTGLAKDALLASVHDNLVLALQMINNMVKHARRGSTWRALDHARHADGCIVKSQWLVERGTQPDFLAMKRTVLPEITAVNDSGFQSLANLLLDRIGEIAADAGMDSCLSEAITSMRTVVDQWRTAGGYVTDTGIHILPEAEYYASLPRRRLGSGLLITNRDDEILMLETTYKPDWEIPGGHADAGESPRVTATREVIEELGLPIMPGNLLVIDHLAHPMPKGDFLAFIYDGGVIDDPRVIAIDHYEIRAAHFVPLERLYLHTNPDMVERLRAAMRARNESRLIELRSIDARS